MADFQILLVGFRDLPPKVSILIHIGLYKGKFLYKIFPQLALVTANDRSTIKLVNASGSCKSVKLVNASGSCKSMKLVNAADF